MPLSLASKSTVAFPAAALTPPGPAVLYFLIPDAKEVAGLTLLLTVDLNLSIPAPVVLTLLTGAAVF